MKRLFTLAFLFFIFGCSPPNDSSNSTVKSNTVSSNSSTTPELPVSNTSFSFPVQGGKEIKADVMSRVENGNPVYVALFSPPIEPTDGNLYMIALQMLEKFYGKGRGLIQLKDAKIQEMPGGKFLCWEIYNPKQNFCLSQVRISDTDKRFGGAAFFVE